jgi:hypothetical protein
MWTRGSAVERRMFPSDSTMARVPVSATARLTPVMPTAQRVPGVPDERRRVVGVELAPGLAGEQLGHLGGAQVHGGRQ